MNIRLNFWGASQDNFPDAFDAALTPALSIEENRAFFYEVDYVQIDRLAQKGTNRKDRLVGTSEDDFILGLKGNDRINGRSGVDTVYGGKGRDRLKGGKGNDTLIGNQDNDRLVGGKGKDLLEGGKGNDRLIGGVDEDILEGGKGNDQLIGGRGADIFILSPNTQKDKIKDFKVGTDQIGLADGLKFSDLTFIDSDIQLNNKSLATLNRIDTTLLTRSNFKVM